VTVTVNITVDPVNDAPTVTGGSITTNEDTASAPFVLSGTDVDGDSLTYQLVTPPTKGTFNTTTGIYTPNVNANGSDGFTFVAKDAALQSAPATVSVTINPVNDAPIFTAVNPASQSVQYSDVIEPVSVSVSDVDDPGASLTISVDSELPRGLVATPGAPGTLTISGNPLVQAGSYPIQLKVVDPQGAMSTASVTIIVSKEDASVAFPNTNPVSVKVNSAGGAAGPVTVCANITEAAGGGAGNISNAAVSFSFSPVSGGSAPTAGAVSYSGGGVGGTLQACTTVRDVRVDVYDVAVTVGGNFYTGGSNTVLAVYDPSLGFVTGGGRFINNGVEANFGINIKYLKNGKPQGSLLYIEHRPNGEVKIKSNSMESLSIVNNTAIILTKATLDGIGNYNVRMTVVDNGEAGTSDQLGLQVTTPDGLNVPELNFAPRVIFGGNIQVPQNKK
jgi:hypothetical protein